MLYFFIDKTFNLYYYFFANTSEGGFMALLLVARDQKPAKVISVDQKEVQRILEKIPVDELFVFSGMTRKVRTYKVDKSTVAVQDRFLRQVGYRWNEELNLWVNGKITSGLITINV